MSDEAQLAAMHLEEAEPQLDEQQQAWVDEKAAPNYGPDDQSREGAAAAIAELRRPSGAAALERALAVQQTLDLGVEHEVKPGVKLTDHFVVPPFTSLDAKAGYWTERKRQWLGLGLESEVGRADALIGFGKGMNRGRAIGTDAGGEAVLADTSIFDPVLCEVAYRWFCPPRGQVVDPFAGGSVRGIVASVLGRRYVGVELREEQVAANRVQATQIVGPDRPFDFGGDPPVPDWTVGDATQLRALTRPISDGAQEADVAAIPPADLIFTCPPYADLEVYSDDPRDLSTAPYPVFRAMLGSVMAQTYEALRADRYAIWVVGEVRGNDGAAYGLVADTVRAGIDAGFGLYNEAIFLTPVGSAAMRATKQVLTSRKLARVHQHVLVFVKGDGRRAADACGDPQRGAL